MDIKTIQEYDDNDNSAIHDFYSILHLRYHCIEHWIAVNDKMGCISKAKVMFTCISYWISAQGWNKIGALLYTYALVPIFMSNCNKHFELLAAIMQYENSSGKETFCFISSRNRSILFYSVREAYS